MMMKLSLCLLCASLAVALDFMFPGSIAENEPKGGASNKDGVIPRSILSGSDACVTPDQEKGTCVPLTSCPSYLDRFRQNQDSNTIAFLRSRICKILPRAFHLCCAETTKNVSESIPSETTKNVSMSIPSETTKNVSMSIPSETTMNISMSTPSETTKNVSESTPSETTKNVSESTPSETKRNASVSIPSETECGLPSSTRIKGGTEAEIGNWPWQAAVGKPLPDSGFQIICGGSLITTRHVLSAAHCSDEKVVPKNLRTHVRVGDHHLTSSSDSLIPQDIKIASRQTKDYNHYTKVNDIELLILEMDVNFNDFVRPVCLPIASSLRNDNFEGRTGTITGWGKFSFDENAPRSNVIMEANVPIVALGPCRDIYQSKTVGTVVDDTNICAGNGNTDACRGDSGGPLNYLNPDNKRYYVIGIVSHGVGCGNPDYPGVYARVGAFIDWIVNNIE